MCDSVSLGAWPLKILLAALKGSWHVFILLSSLRCNYYIRSLCTKIKCTKVSDSWPFPHPVSDPLTKRSGFCVLYLLRLQRNHTLLWLANVFAYELINAPCHNTLGTVSATERQWAGLTVRWCKSINVDVLYANAFTRLTPQIPPHPNEMFLELG